MNEKIDLGGQIVHRGQLLQLFNEYYVKRINELANDVMDEITSRAKKGKRNLKMQFDEDDMKDIKVLFCKKGYETKIVDKTLIIEW